MEVRILEEGERRYEGGEGEVGRAGVIIWDWHDHVGMTEVVRRRGRGTVGGSGRSKSRHDIPY